MLETQALLLRVFKTLLPACLSQRDRLAPYLAPRTVDNPRRGLDCMGVFARLGHLLLIIALLTALGAHWAILQSLAWSTMLAENLRSRSLQEAVGRTFDGQHPCALCKAIATSKQSEKKSEFRLEWRKFEFSYHATAFIFSAPSFYWEVSVQTISPGLADHTPPVPPPRRFLG